MDTLARVELIEALSVVDNFVDLLYAGTYYGLTVID